MTGYLQRLAMSNGRAPPRLHPFVGVMFAESPEKDAPPLPRGDPFAASDDRTAAATPDAVAADARVPPDTASQEPAEQLTARVLPARVRRGDEPPMAQSREPRDMATRHSDDARADTTDAQRDNFRPLLGEVTAHASGGARRDEVDAQPATSRAPPLASGDDRADRADLPAVVHAARSAARPGASETPRALPPVSGASRNPAAGDRRAAAQPRQLGGEDIHIHIGRVEVTAAPPPAPRPPAAPPRKTMTLEEYLGRPNGASR
jgi:hypothetical protein